VASQPARDGDGDNGAPLAAPLERLPASVQAAGAAVGPCADRGRMSLSTSPGLDAVTRRQPLMPGRLNQQPARVRVAGLGEVFLDDNLPGGSM